MLEQKTTGVTEYAAEQAARGSGQLGLTTDYMLADPVTYYHDKFSKKGDKYFNEAMWSEAARRGESEALISSLLKNAGKTNEAFDELNEYGGRMDYDTYMLALEAPFLDDTKEVERIADNGVSFGKYTDKQWAANVLKSTTERYDAEIIQEQKENQGFLSKAFWTVVTGLDKMVVGVARAGQDWVNIIQGLGNVLTGKDFLAAFADDEGELFHEIAKGLDLAIYEYQRNYTNAINAVEAYEQGYRPGAGKTFAEQVDNTVGVGAGYTTWGKWMNAMTDSIGYMLPTMLLTIPTGGTSTFAQFGATGGASTLAQFGAKGAAKVAGVSAKTAAAIKNGLFYTQIFSGMVGENVETAMANGATLDQINHAEIISNAAIKAVAQWGVEKALGAIMGFSGLDRLMGATAAKGTTGLGSQALKTGAKIAEQAGRKGMAAFGTAVGRIGKDLLKEGLEETLQDMSDGIIDTIYGGTYATRGKETLSISNLLDSFIVGAMTAGVTGAISGASVIWKRDAMIDNDGKAYKLGVFQQMNYNEAMKTMSDWSATLNDTTASAQEKADAAFKLNAAMSTLGNIFKTFGTKRTQKALSLLTVYQEHEDAKKRNKAKERLSNVGFAKSLLVDFKRGQTKANLQYIKQTVLKKVQKALEKKSDKLKAANVTELNNIITEDINPNDPEISISKDAASDLKAALKELGISVLVGHNGNIVTRSGEVVFANDSLIRSGDVTTILKGIAYDVAVEAYKNAMNSRQKQFLLDHYKQLTNNENATIENAVTALLFDKDFYCYMLLKTKEKAKPSTLFNNRSLQLLATMDKVVKSIASNENVKGRLSSQAYKLLISKIQENMKTGLFTFATQYAYIDLANVSKEIVGDTDLSALKTAIKMNKNVQFTETVNSFIDIAGKLNKPLPADRIEKFDACIDKYAALVGPTIIADLKNSIRSTNYNDRVDAAMSLIYAAQLDNTIGKTIYLPEINNVDMVLYGSAVLELETMFGQSLQKFIDGDIDSTRIPFNTQNYIIANGIDLTNRSERMAYISEQLYNKSNGTYTMDINGNVASVLNINQLLKTEYKDTNALFKAIKDYKVTKLGDIMNAGILNNVKIAMLSEQGFVGLNLGRDSTAAYSPDNNTIYLNQAKISPADITSKLGHEATHACQNYLFNVTKDSNIKYLVGSKEEYAKYRKLVGANEKTFSSMSKKDRADLAKYISENFPRCTELMETFASEDTSYSQLLNNIAYFQVSGELQAFTRINGVMFETGFTYSADGKQLISPDGKKQWNLFESIKETKETKEVAPKVAETPASRIPDVQKGLRFISQKRALLSNLKYFIKKGATIQMHSGLAAFIEGTTHDFKKLPKVIRNEIEAGTLTKQKLDYYLQTTKSMNDYTYQMAAKYIFKNEAAAEISYNDMKQIQDNIQQLAAVSYVLSKTTNKTLQEYGKKKLSPKQMFEVLTLIQNQIKQGNTKLESLFAKGIQWASTVYAGQDANGKPQYFEASEDYSDRLNLYFLRHYDGTFNSIYDLNNLGKYTIMKEQPAQFSDYMKKSAGGTYNWTERLKKADIDYESASTILDTTVGVSDPGVTQALDRIDRQDKINAIEDYLLKNLEAQIAKAGPEGSQARIDAARATLPEYNKQRSQIETMSDETLNQKYLLATGAEMLQPKKAVSTEQITKVDKTKEQIGTHATDKTRKNAIVNEAKRLRDMMGKVSPVTYKNMPADLKAVMTQAADGTLVLNDTYLNMNSQQLESLIKSFQDFSNKYRALKNITEAELGLRARTKKTKEYLQKLTDEKAKTSKEGVQAPRVDAKGNNIDTAKPKTMKEKVDVIHRVKIKEESFSFNSREQVTDTVKQVLNTAWDKERMSTVKGLSNNENHNVSNGKAFYEQNAKALSNMTLAEAEATAKWFMDTQMVNTTNDTEEYKKFSAVQLYTLGYIYGQTKNNGIFSQMNANTKQQIENFLRTQATTAGTALAVWNNIQDKINPIEQIFKNLEIGGVELTDAEQNALVKAAEENDIEQIAKLQNQILDRIKNEKISKKGIGKQITTYRAMAMLSSPLTWLRNTVSNAMLKVLNKLSSKIGDNIWKSKQGVGQLRLLEGVKVDQKTGRIIGGTIDTNIQNFVNEHFIDNKLFDTLVSDLSKYNPSDIQQKYRQPDGTINKNALFANMVLKSLYNKYYNQNMFKGKFMNSVYQGLMKMMSDNNYVREAAVRYFGKILADRKYDLSQGVTDNIMTDFANAVGIAMADYMHSDNFLNSFERIIAEKGEGWHTVYKLIMPFAASNWNWFKAAIRFSPIGLGQSIYKMIRLENTIIKAEAAWAAGKSQISPEMTEYLVRRDLGSGIIGTMSLILGAALAGLGFIKLEDEDYGTPKLCIGNIKIDISSVFGSSSLLVGAGLINGFQKKGLSFDGLLEALNNSLDIAADGFFLTDLMALDLYSNGQFSTLLNISESVLLSFIPNIVSYLAGATYFGDKKKTKFWQKLVAKIPFLANILPDKIDPYTGQTSGMLGVFNRMMPYIDINIESSQAKIAKSFGLNKKELSGKYTINDEAFNLSASETANINKSYGEWNAKYLTEFLDNSTSYSVKDSKTGTIRMLSYNQMDGAQRSAVMKRIMNNNSKYAKILAWTNAGNQYYASDTEYSELIERGITKNVYHGNKGFIKK